MTGARRRLGFRIVVNSYTGLAAHYDLIMTSGYYDYDDYARTILDLIGDRRQILEVGVGTGLVCERLLDTGPPDLMLTGIDHTDSMITQARARLGSRAACIQQDILHMAFPPAFDAAFSVGGVWFYIHDGHDACSAATSWTTTTTPPPSPICTPP
jgi:ubiquinone/menaquinone biosynthesis C-methylase UbiE